VHATSWAILNRERVHGITWHEMVDRPDAGRILKQRAVEISETDTAFSLNTKCYEAGIDAFAELVEDLVLGRVAPIEQDLGNRTYFAKEKRPYAACTISWQKPAAEIAALVRALSFGLYPNPLGLPKLVVNDTVALASEVEILSRESTAAPGTVVSLRQDWIQVATATSDIVLRRLLTCDGGPLPLADLVAGGLREGTRLEELGRQRADRITAVHRDICRHEDFWVGRLSDLQPIRVPYARPCNPLPDRGVRSKQCWSMAADNPVPSISVRDGATRAEVLVACFAAYLGRLAGQSLFDVGFSEPGLRREVDGLEGFFATTFRCEWRSAMRPLRLKLYGTSWMSSVASSATRPIPAT